LRQRKTRSRRAQEGRSSPDAAAAAALTSSAAARRTERHRRATSRQPKRMKAANLMRRSATNMYAPAFKCKAAAVHRAGLQQMPQHQQLQFVPRAAHFKRHRQRPSQIHSRQHRARHGDDRVPVNKVSSCSAAAACVEGREQHAIACFFERCARP
jgi:hypothetical protein